jgi:hypothetical protein
MIERGLLLAIRFLKSTGKKEWKGGLKEAEKAVKDGSVDYDVVIPKFIDLFLDNREK